MVKRMKKSLVAPCICRREKTIMGEGCDRPEESCLVFGMGAEYYLKNGIGRMIDTQEVLEILKRADKTGLVLQPSNAQHIMNICCCCGCCCGVLRSFKRHPKPASIVSSAFIAQAEAGTCKGCGVCLKRCQMEALELVDEKVVLNPDRCIGCGLCVSTCPTGSLTLKRKPASELPEVPRGITESYIKLGRARGKMNYVGLAKMTLKSKLDRLLAAK
ncbi:MAG: 4Fe-4S binding protein [Deltaproteobacteria bacterium]|nr:4Fe-4S binding protein [Deltaproteobacteria bacterium]